jgi:hypothetical protein
MKIKAPRKIIGKIAGNHRFREIWGAAILHTITARTNRAKRNATDINPISRLTRPKRDIEPDKIVTVTARVRFRYRIINIAHIHGLVNFGNMI